MPDFTPGWIERREFAASPNVTVDVVVYEDGSLEAFIRLDGAVPQPGSTDWYESEDSGQTSTAHQLAHDLRNELHPTAAAWSPNPPAQPT
jgi:hypothetical protein